MFWRFLELIKYAGVPPISMKIFTRLFALFGSVFCISFYFVWFHFISLLKLKGGYRDFPTESPQKTDFLRHLNSGLKLSVVLKIQIRGILIPQPFSLGSQEPFFFATREKCRSIFLGQAEFYSALEKKGCCHRLLCSPYTIAAILKANLLRT